MAWKHAWNYADSYAYVARVADGLGPVIVCCAVNGILGKEVHPATPETPEEIAAACKEAYDAGASIVHVHARDPHDLAAPAGTAEIYREVNAAIRAACPDLIVNNTGGGGLTTTMEERLDCIRASPEMASISIGPDMARYEIPARPAPLPNPHEGGTYDVCLPFTYGLVEQIAGALRDADVKAEMDLLHPGNFWVSRMLIEQGLLEPPYVFEFVMGHQTSIFATPANVVQMVRELPSDSIFFCMGMGPLQTPMTVQSLIMGGHVRVGIEDRVERYDGTPLRGNGDAVEWIAGVARSLGREVATPAQAREMLGLPATPRQWH